MLWESHDTQQVLECHAMLCHGWRMPRHARQCHASMPCVLMRIHVMCCRLHACIRDFRAGFLLDLQVPCKCLTGFPKWRKGSQGFTSSPESIMHDARQRSASKPGAARVCLLPLHPVLPCLLDHTRLQGRKPSLQSASAATCNTILVTIESFNASTALCSAAGHATLTWQWK